MRAHNVPMAAAASRRAFLLGIGPAAALAAPWGAAASDPDLEAVRTSEGSRLWRRVRREFEPLDDVAPFNAANMAPPCRGARLAYEAVTRSTDRDASFTNRAPFEASLDTTRSALARLLRADPSEIAVVRNATEANNAAVWGAPLDRGDEVVLWDQNHESNSISWDVRAAREGLSVKRVSTPQQPSSAEALIAPFRAAMGPRTRMVSFSHVSNISGVALPAQELCALAAAHGAWAHVDGAQAAGAMAIDLPAMGCDIYTASGQKWLGGPREAGLLYVRRGRAAAMRPLIVGYGWHDDGPDDASRFQMLGQRDDAAVAALGAAAMLHLAVGPERVEARIRGLTDLLMARIDAKTGHAEFVTPREAAHRLGVVILPIRVADADEAARICYATHGVSGAIFPGEPNLLRLCPHIYLDEEDVERAANAAAALV